MLNPDMVRAYVVDLLEQLTQFSPVADTLELACRQGVRFRPALTPGSLYQGPLTGGVSSGLGRRDCPR